VAWHAAAADGCVGNPMWTCCAVLLVHALGGLPGPLQNVQGSTGTGLATAAGAAAAAGSRACPRTAIVEGQQAACGVSWGSQDGHVLHVDALEASLLGFQAWCCSGEAIFLRRVVTS
jgi:hypothetical protein